MFYMTTNKKANLPFIPFIWVGLHVKNNGWSLNVSVKLVYTESEKCISFKLNFIHILIVIKGTSAI